MTLDPCFFGTAQARVRNTERRLEQSEHPLAMNSNDVSIVSARDEDPISEDSHCGFVAANEAVDAALTLALQSAARRRNLSEIDFNAVGGSFCEACHRSALPTFSVLEQLRPESACRSTLSLASEGSDTEDPLYRVPPPHREKVALPLGYSFLLTARTGDSPSRPCSPDSWDPYFADDELSDSLSTISGHCSGTSYETDITEVSDPSLMTDELGDEDDSSEYPLTPEDEEVTVVGEWHPNLWHGPRYYRGNGNSLSDGII
jgi:hypothetical protein